MLHQTQMTLSPDTALQWCRPATAATSSGQEWWPEQLTGKCHRCFCVDRKGIPQPLLQDLRGFEQWRLAFQRKHAWNREDPLRIAHCEFEVVIKAKFVDVGEMPNLPHDR